MNIQMMDIVLMSIGIAYGAVLILSAFIRNKITDALRIDAVFMPKPTPATRMINIPIGLFVLAYSVYTLLKSLR